MNSVEWSVPISDSNDDELHSNESGAIVISADWSDWTIVSLEETVKGGLIAFDIDDDDFENMR